MSLVSLQINAIQVYGELNDLTIAVGDIMFELNTVIWNHRYELYICSQKITHAAKEEQS